MNLLTQSSKICTGGLLAAFLGLLSFGAAHSQVTDITVNNGQGTSPSDYTNISPTNEFANQNTEVPPDYNTNPDLRTAGGTPVQALGYLNANCIPDKSWDLEAFGYTASTSTLTYVGGFNPTQANEGYSLGDIFLSTPSTSTISQPSGLSQNEDYSNPGYSYAIHFTGTSATTLSYTIYALTGGTQLQTVAFNQNLDSDPYALDLTYDLANNNIAAVYSGTTSVALKTNLQVNNLLDENLFYQPGVIDSPLADNYVASFDLSTLDLSSFNASLTEQCGNDALSGSSSAVIETTATPEPKSVCLALMATALFLFGVVLKRRSLKA
jgi:hypothetical protein